MCQGKVDLDGFNGGVTSRSPGRVIREVVSLEMSQRILHNLQDLLTIPYSCSAQYQRYLAIFVYNRQQELAAYSHTAGRRPGGIVRCCGIIPFRHRVEACLDCVLFYAASINVNRQYTGGVHLQEDLQSSHVDLLLISMDTDRF